MNFLHSKHQIQNYVKNTKIQDDKPQFISTDSTSGDALALSFINLPRRFPLKKLFFYFYLKKRMTYQEDVRF